MWANDVILQNEIDVLLKPISVTTGVVRCCDMYKVIHRAEHLDQLDIVEYSVYYSNILLPR